jgi:hypothetical protein
MLKDVLKAILKTIPPKVQQDLAEPEVRKSILEAYGEDAFLDSKNLKYPIVNPDSGKVRSDLLYAGYVKAKMNNHTESVEKAKYLFESLNCKEELSIKIQDIDHSVIDITEMMFIDELEETTLDWIE